MIEVYVLFGFMFADMIFTYLNAYKMSLKDKEFWKYELNPLTQKFLKRHGVHKGMRFAITSSTIMLLAVVVWLRIRTNPLDFSRLIFFSMGAYGLMGMIHIYMFKSLWFGGNEDGDK